VEGITNSKVDHMPLEFYAGAINYIFARGHDNCVAVVGVVDCCLDVIEVSRAIIIDYDCSSRSSGYH